MKKGGAAWHRLPFIGPVGTNRLPKAAVPGPWPYSQVLQSLVSYVAPAPLVTIASLIGR